MGPRAELGMVRGRRVRAASANGRGARRNYEWEQPIALQARLFVVENELYDEEPSLRRFRRL